MKLHSKFLGLGVLNLALIFAVLSRAQAQLHRDQECKDAVDCSRPLDILASDKRDLGSISTKNDIDRLCPDMKQRISCIDRHIKWCMAPNKQAMFNVLYNGTIIFITELCHNETYQQEFLKHAPCMNARNVKDNVENCEAKYKVALDDIQRSRQEAQEDTAQGGDTIRRICCSFQEYLDCSDRTVRTICGPEARTFHKNMLDTMAYALIKEQCVRFPADSEECRETSMASATMAGVGSVLSASPFLLLLLLLALLQGARRT